MTEKDVDSVSHFSPAVAVATPPPPWPVAYATATPPPLWPWRSHRHFGKAKVAVAWPWRTPPATVAPAAWRLWNSSQKTHLGPYVSVPKTRSRVQNIVHPLFKSIQWQFASRWDFRPARLDLLTLLFAGTVSNKGIDPNKWLVKAHYLWSIPAGIRQYVTPCRCGILRDHTQGYS